MSMIETTAAEQKIAERVDPTIAAGMSLAQKRTSGLTMANLREVIEFAKYMAIANIGIRKHLRGNVGACLSVLTQALEWEISPFATANKSYLVNDQIAYESQLINAVILKRAPIKGRFKVDYVGEGPTRRCRVVARLRDEDETVDYQSPEIQDIKPQNSPLWKTDPDQQLFYYSSRALCRRHFPDVLLAVYAVDEVPAEDLTPSDGGGARYVTPKRDIGSRLDALAETLPVTVAPFDPETGVIWPAAAAETVSAAERPVETAAGAVRTAPVDESGAGLVGVVLPSEPAPDAARSLADDLAETGIARAHEGSEAFRYWIDNDITDDERAMISAAQVRQWTKAAAAADAGFKRRG